MAAPGPAPSPADRPATGALVAPPPPRDRALVLFHRVGSRWPGMPLLRLPTMLVEALRGVPGATVERSPEAAAAAGGWTADGVAWALADFPGALALLETEAGAHLEVGAAAGCSLVQVTVLPLKDGEAPSAAADAPRRAGAGPTLAADLAATANGPPTLGRIVRAYAPAGGNGVTFDFAAGLACRGDFVPDSLRRFLLARLPPPPELLGD